jgi:hypothetical protein
VLVGVGLTLLGYYVGREVGRVQHLREELDRRGPRGGIPTPMGTPGPAGRGGSPGDPPDA